MFTYDQSKNKDGAQITGVPLADISKEQFEKYSEHIQAAIKAASFYVQKRTKKSEVKAND